MAAETAFNLYMASPPSIGGAVGFTLANLAIKSLFYTDSRKAFYPGNLSAIKGIGLGMLAGVGIFAANVAVGGATFYLMDRIGLKTSSQGVFEAFKTATIQLTEEQTVLVNFITYITPIYEEIIFRGYLRNWFMGESVKPGVTERLKSWMWRHLPLKGSEPSEFKTALKTSAIFALLHIEPSKGWANLQFLLQIGLMGMAFYGLRKKTGNLWACTTAHSVNNSLATGFKLAAHQLLAQQKAAARSGWF